MSNIYNGTDQYQIIGLNSCISWIGQYTLVPVNTPRARTLQILSEDRSFNISNENRTMNISNENRTTVIQC